jgi:hypothetical protein
MWEINFREKQLLAPILNSEESICCSSAQPHRHS